MQGEIDLDIKTRLSDLKSSVNNVKWWIITNILISIVIFVLITSSLPVKEQPAGTAKTTITLKGYAILSNNRIEVFTKDTIYIIDLQSKKEVNDKIIKGAE